MKLVAKISFLTLLACFPMDSLWSKSLKVEKDSLLEQIKTQKTLRVATRYSLTTYYQNPSGEFRGLEHDLIKRFAKELGVEPQIIVVSDIQQLLSLIKNHRVDFAVGLTSNEQRKSIIRFGPAYQTVTQQVVYRYDDSPPPSDLADFDTNHILHVIADSSQAKLLKDTQKKYPKLCWKAVKSVETVDLLKQVWKGDIRYALVNSNEIAQVQRFYPELRVSFEFPIPQQLAWAFPPSLGDGSLYNATVKFFNQLDQSGDLERLIERHYGHLNTEEFDYVDTSRFYRHVKERLPTYRRYFKQVAEDLEIDWRLLAAIGYQESHWNPHAVSRTGVRGIMMLTKSTAKELGVKDRTDPFQSIEGGSKYLVMLKKRLNGDIPEPDKMWLALAAYNVGLGHLRDARKLVRQQGKRSDYWVNVEKTLLLLSKPRWYKKTNYGRARGYEAVAFVKNVRRFYDMLLQLEGKKIQMADQVLPIWSEYNFANVYKHINGLSPPEYVVRINPFPPYLLD